MKIDRLDHLVLTVVDINKTIDFYTRVLNMTQVEFGEGRKALIFGNQKINLHESGKEFTPHAGQPLSGSADLCFILDCRISQAVQKLINEGVDIIEGPVSRTGAIGLIESVYLRDPDNNLIELSEYSTVGS